MPKTNNNSVDPEILGRILLLQNAMQVAPDEERMFELIIEGLSCIPGASSCSVKLEGNHYPPDQEVNAVTNSDHSTHHFPLNTIEHRYGKITFAVSERDIFELYEPFIKNTANLIALFIENWRYQNQLKSFNEQLEARVADRTEELEKSAQRFRSIFEQAAVGVALIESKTGCFVRINQHFCDMLGYSHDEISGCKNFQEITHPDDLDLGLENMAKLLAGDIREFRIEKRYFHRDGHTVWANLSVSATWNPGEEPTNHIAVAVDVTERRLAEKALRTSQELLLEAEHIAQMGNWELDIATGCASWSHQVHQIVGTSPSQKVGPEFLSTIVNPEDWPSVFSSLTAAMEEGKTHEQEYRINRPDGEERWLYCKAERKLDAMGHPKKLTGIVQDITERKRTQLQLAHAGREWTQAMDRFDDAIYLVDMQRHLLRANSAFYKMIDSDAEHSLGRHIVELMHPEDESDACPICQLQESHIESMTTLEADDPHNPIGHPIEASMKLMLDEDETATGMLLRIRDLSRDRMKEQRLRLAASVFENTDEGVVITDAKGKIIEVNRAFTQILGYDRKEVLGHNPNMWQSGRHEISFYRDMWQSLLNIGQWQGEIWNRHKSGSIFPSLMTISSVTDHNEKLTHYVSTFTDISHIKRSQEQLDHLAHHDSLTGLPNRLLLNERMDQSIKHAERNITQLAVIFLDLDNFKLINDGLGHPVGDQLLQEISTKLVNTVREQDTVSRIGGDEFVLLLEDIGIAENAGIAATKIMSVFADAFRLDIHEIRVTASLGVCIYPRDGQDTTTLLRNADAAMYRAKHEGRDNYQFYTEELTRNAFERMLLENNLRQAIEKEQLTLFYQPQINLTSGNIIGVESLIRWNHPDLGMIPPAKFIPMAEQSGLIHPIGQWVLRTACIQGVRWLEQGIFFGRIAVNIAGPQLQRGHLVPEVIAILKETGLPTELLELEITESFIMKKTEAAIKQLHSLQKIGLTLAIDDFGTGYSSLSHLKQLPVNRLKIDQSFIRDIPDDQDDMAISDAMIAMARSLGLTVIAEGVETEKQASFLRQAGCHEAQGYLYSRPVSPDNLIELLPQSESTSCI